VDGAYHSRMHAVLEAEFRSLLDVWRHHDDLRRRCASVPELSESRRELERVRDRVRELRRALAPRDDERQGSVATVMCDSLQSPVVVPWHRAARHGDRLVYPCVCGATTTMPASSQPKD